MKSLFKTGTIICLLLSVLLSNNTIAQEQETDVILLNNATTRKGWVTLVGPYEIRYRTDQMAKKAEKKNLQNKIDAKKKEVEEKFQVDMQGLDENNEEDKKKIEKLKLKKAKKLDKLDSKYTLKVMTENVFSITYAETGEEQIIYTPDTLGLLVIDTIRPEVEYSVTEMRNYIKGRIDGRKQNASWSTVGGLAAGLTGSVLGAFYGPIIPAVYVTIVSTRRPRIDFNNVSDPTLMGNEAYEDGYTKSAKRKKVRNVVISSVGSLAVGVVTLQLILR